MDSSQQIHEALNRKDYKKALLVALSNSLEIKLKTSLKTDTQVYSITKKISLIQGSHDHIDSELLDAEYESVINFHQKQIKEIHQTWEDNRETLLQAFEIMSGGNVNLEPLKIGHSNNSPTEDLKQEYISDIPEEFEDFGVEENPTISSMELDDLEEVTEDEFTQIISPDDVEEHTYDDFEGSFEEDTIEENWVDDVVIQDSSHQESHISENDYVAMDEEEADSLFSEGDDDFATIDSSSESATEEDWGDLLNESDNHATAEAVTPDNIDNWNEWIESQDNGEISCNPEEIDWSEDDWSDTPA